LLKQNADGVTTHHVAATLSGENVELAAGRSAALALLPAHARFPLGLRLVRGHGQPLHIAFVKYFWERA
jgi:hypothetical protein